VDNQDIFIQSHTYQSQTSPAAAWCYTDLSHLINEQLGKILCSEHKLRNIENAFRSIHIVNIESFDWQPTSSQRQNHMNRPSCLGLTLQRRSVNQLFKFMNSTINCKQTPRVMWLIHAITNFTIQQSRSFEGVWVPLRLVNCLFPIPDSQPTATEHFQSPLYGSGTVFCSISNLLRHFLSSALTWRHTSSNFVTRNNCCHAREATLSFMDTLITLTYL